MPRQFTFDCPECDAVVAVGGEIRTEILANGCVLCAVSVDADAFSPAPRDAE
ncbi:hypothetical protein C474_06977 [Halogeometricum pallidum JCM 14848]|uniref:Small CPxCG-related zinc finger protein n=1 Tax=Halogeometricum pallidum JCM 14848 TaxID=1227487 RepID=M0DCM7_HALPD|nr:hypothetical protein [Halogeometricum pallidum]ELZ32543.1 hypothetical protein C474_06977 [Halogeometricum pallidum JCM 14848]